MLVSQVNARSDPTLDALREIAIREKRSITIGVYDSAFRRLAAALRDWYQPTNKPRYIRVNERGIVLILRTGHLVVIDWYQIPKHQESD